MPWERSTWIPPCLRISIINWYEGTLDGLIKQGLSPTQVMVHHKAYIKEKALNNGPMTHDTFVLPCDLRNLAKNEVDELS
jgi:hypothetical protein